MELLEFPAFTIKDYDMSAALQDANPIDETWTFAIGSTGKTAKGFRMMLGWVKAPRIRAMGFSACVPGADAEIITSGQNPAY